MGKGVLSGVAPPGRLDCGEVREGSSEWEK